MLAILVVICRLDCRATTHEQQGLMSQAPATSFAMGSKLFELGAYVRYRTVRQGRANGTSRSVPDAELAECGCPQGKSTRKPASFVFNIDRSKSAKMLGRNSLILDVR